MKPRGIVRLSKGLVDRRTFLGTLAGALLAAPLGAHAQQPATPVIGYLSQRSPTDSASIVAAFRQGLEEMGFVEGQNVTIESRFAEGQIDRVPALAKELVRRRVNVFVATGGTGSVVKAKPLVPRTIPIIFAMGGDPVKLGVVASFARPGDNITGVCFLLSEVAAKQVELLHELVPPAAMIGFLVNPKDPTSEAATSDAQAAAHALGHQLVIVNASTPSEIDSAFAALAQRHIAAVFVSADPLYTVNSLKIVALAARHAMLTVTSTEGFAADGGLISYGTSINEANRQLGVYTGQVLKGTRPGDLPVQQSTKFQLAINLKTAKALGLTIPPSLLQRADQVIE